MNEENENKVNESTNDPIKDGGERSNTAEVPAPIKVKKDWIDIWYEKRVASREAKAKKKAAKAQCEKKGSIKKYVLGGAALVFTTAACAFISAGVRAGNNNHIDGSNLITDAGVEPEVGASCDQTMGSGEEA